MRRALSIMLMALILGLSFSAAVSQSFVLAEVQEDEAYEEFWNILNKEAELIVKLNSTADANEIQSLALQLIQNSRNGSSNAAQISALIWQGLEELKNSGVKTYYTAEELRQMAQNISENGLPDETVQLLKQQGWSDEEIQALQEYIAENAENITEDFNLTAFLENFSTALVQVAFKYNHYEAWAVRKLVPILNYPEIYRFEPVSAQVAPSFVRNLKILVPIFKTIRIDELSTNPNLTLVENAKNEVFKLLSGEKDGEVIYQKIIKDGSTSCRINDSLLKLFNRSLTSDNQTLNGIKVVRVLSNFRNKVLAGDTTIVEVRLLKIGKKTSRDDIVSFNDNQEVEVVVQTTVVHIGFDNNCIPQVDVYEEVTAYSWDGLKAYEKLSNLEALLQAKEFGNHDEGINKQISSTATEISQYFTLKDKRVIWSYSWSIITIPIKPKIGISAKKDSLSDDNEGYLAVSYSVVPEDVTSEYATYKVRVGLTAENNVVNDVSVTVDGTELEDSTHYSMIHPDDGTVTWTSKESGKVYGNNEVTVSGTIKVTYTPHCGDLPTSKDLFSSGASPLSCNQPVTITKNYSTTISLTNNIDPDKVSFYIIPSDSRVRPGESVTFYVKVVNKNDEPVSGSYELHITVPTGNGYSEPITKRGSISVSSNDDSGLIPVTTITYTDTGTYGYSGTFKFNNGYEKQDSGDIIVESDSGGSSGSLSIESVSILPQEPKDGDLVNLTVRVENTYDSDKIIKLKLYVDGSKVGEVTDSINGNSEETFTLHWFSEEGEHEWRIELYSKIGNNVWSYDDGDSGSIIVQSDDTVSCENGEYWTAWLEVASTRVVGEGKVHIAVKASYCQALPDVGGGQISLLDLKGNLYIDDNEVDSFNTVNSGESLSIGETKVIDEFDWPMGIGNHTIILKVKNLSGLQENMETKTDTITVEILPSNNEYPLKLTDIWCDNIKFNFEASNHYTQGKYISPLTCTFKFENIEGEPVYITELSTDISVSPPDLKKAIPSHTTVSVNEEIEPGEFIMIQIQDRAVTTDRQMLLRVDGTTAILYFNYIIEGIINGVSKIVSNGVDRVDVDVSVYQGTVYADMMGDVIIFIAGPKAEEDIVTKIPIITKLTKIPGVKQILGFLSLEPFKNAIVYGIDRVFGG